MSAPDPDEHLLAHPRAKCAAARDIDNLAAEFRAKVETALQTDPRTLPRANIAQYVLAKTQSGVDVDTFRKHWRGKCRCRA
jgi:hypothetical protein